MNTAQAQRQIVVPSQWETVLAQYETAKDLYERFKADVLEPADRQERAFEESHGLPFDAPSYFKRKRDLQEAHHYQKPRAIDETADHLCDLMSDAEDIVMSTPAPDHAALLLKLEKLLAISNGSTDGWSEAYARQTIEDMRRLLS